MYSLIHRSAAYVALALCLSFPALALAQVEVDIEFTSTESADPVIAGSGTGNLIYVVTAANISANDATGVQGSATVMFPAGVTIDTVTPSVGTWSNTLPGTWDIGGLATATSATLTFEITVGPATAAGMDVINLSANLSAVNEIDTNPANDSTAQSTSVGLTSATWRVNKDFVDDNPGSVTMSLSCTSGTVSAPVQVSEGNPMSLNVQGFLTGGFGSTTCTVSESDLPGGYYQESATADCEIVGVEHDAEYLGCVFVNAPFQANFEVTKDFDDDNPADVEVMLSCNTGLPLQQTTMINEGGGVNFVVVDFEPGAMDCEVSEVVPDGYSASYVAGGPSNPTSDENGCSFTAVSGGAQNSCAITNTLQPVDVIVNKQWIDEHPEYNLSTVVEVTLTCNAEIVNGIPNGNWYREIFVDPNNPGLFQVFPHWDGSTSCFATEDPEAGVLQDVSDCEFIPVAPGVGGECTIVNTRLFAGIPTLGQYGLALLALLLLGMGLVAYRRFA
jgi:hypothetical protein